MMFEQLAPIQTVRLRIALLTMQDVPALWQITHDIASSISFLPNPFTMDDAKTLATGIDGGRHRFAGLWRDETLIGVLGMFMRDNTQLEVGYWIGSAFRGAGLATEALAGAVRTLRSVFPACSIIAECRPANGASQKVLENVGFLPTRGPASRAGMERYEFVETMVQDPNSDDRRRF